MRTRFLTAIGAAALVAFPTTAFAQDAAGEGFVGVSAGYHDLNLNDEDAEDLGIEVDDGSPIVGVYAGYDFPLGTNLFAGVEGNFHFGTDAIDTEYGASVRLGFRAEGGAKYYIRGGYQEVDIDVEEVLDTEIPGIEDFDTSEGDYLVGLGVDFPVGERTGFRVNLDTISFDSLRATAGFALKF